MFEHILEHLNSVLLKDPEEEPSSVQKMYRNNEAYGNTRTAFYIGGESYLSNLNRCLSDGGWKTGYFMNLFLSLSDVSIGLHQLFR